MARQSMVEPRWGIASPRWGIARTRWGMARTRWGMAGRSPTKFVSEIESLGGDGCRG